MADADLVIAMLDISEKETDEDVEILQSVESVPHLVVLNKVDKVDTETVREFRRQLESQLGDATPRILTLSAKTHQGLDTLKREIVEPFSPEQISSDGFLVSDARHYDLLRRATDEIGHSIALLDQNTTEELILVGLHNALRYLGQITGETTTEDMLTRIFATFCIGK